MGKPTMEIGVTVSSSDRTIEQGYKIICKLDEGGQGKTEVVKRKFDNRVFVRKTQKRFQMHGSIPEEMHILENVLSPHPSLVAFDHCNYIKKNSSLVLYFEHCEGGDLSDYVPNPSGKRVSENFIWHCFQQLADALAFLHYGYDRKAKDPYIPRWQPVIHRDVKPENVFLRYKLSKKFPNPDVVLGDFGLATLTGVSRDCGTYKWVGPELGSDRITAKSDVWGLGAVIHALAHGEGPVGSPPKEWGRGRDVREEWYLSPQARKPRYMSRFYSDELNDNMIDCLTKDPNNRVASDSLVRHLEKDMPRKKR